MLGDRLKSARIKAGLSLDNLVIKADNIVSKQAISQYEKNQKTPSSGILIALAKALDVNLDYFFRQRSISIGKVDFRKHSDFGKKQQESLKEKVKDELEKYLELEEILSIAKTFQNPLNSYSIQSLEDVENAATQLRENWKLGLDPINNFMGMLELKDIKVIYIFEESIRFNGLSGWAENSEKHPFVVINSNETLPLDRKRFTAAHELGHLLLEQSITNTQLDHEKVANRFAGAFLLPKETIENELFGKRSKISLLEIANIKKKYKISIQAIMYRLKDLGYISESKYKTFAIMDNSHKYDKQVLLSGSNEEINRFDNLLAKAYSENYISGSKLAQLSGKNLNIVLEQFGAIF